MRLGDASIVGFVDVVEHGRGVLVDKVNDILLNEYRVGVGF